MSGVLLYDMIDIGKKDRLKRITLDTRYAEEGWNSQRPGAGGHMFSDIQLLQLKNHVNRILHAPGNFTGGVLEMAVVADYHIPTEELREDCRKIAQMLKKDDTFRNVRLNLIKWVSEDCIEKEVIPMMYLLTGSAFEKQLETETGTKTLDELFRQLKLFYARSKVILILTDGSYEIADKEAVKAYLQPFLARKLLLIKNGEQIPGTKLFLTI